MQVGILSQWFDPEPGPAALPGVLARKLMGRGHSVQVVTGFPNYPSGIVSPGYRIRRRLDENLDGVSVRRVALFPSHGRSTIGRVANYASFGASAVVSGLSVLKHIDALWVYNSPITVSWPSWAVHIVRQIPSVVHVMDLWPDTLLASGFARPGLTAATRALLNPWCNAVYRSAASVAYISPGVGETLRLRGVPDDKLAYVPLWADEDIFHPSELDIRDELGIPVDAIVLLYAGALGEAQGLSALIEACADITDQRFVCLIAGAGGSEESLREQAVTVRADNIRFLGRIPQEQMTSLLATADLVFIGLRAHALSEMTIPSKTQAAMAAGLPLLAAAGRDVSDLVRQSGTGWAVRPGDSIAIAGAIRAACAAGHHELRALGKRARNYYEDQFSVAAGVQRIEYLLQDATEARHALRRRQ